MAVTSHRLHSGQVQPDSLPLQVPDQSDDRSNGHFSPG
jgi:hypothetical protein